MNSTYATKLALTSQADVNEHEKHFTGLAVTCLEAHGILQATLSKPALVASGTLFFPYTVSWPRLNLTELLYWAASRNWDWLRICQSPVANPKAQATGKLGGGAAGEVPRGSR